MPFPAASTPTVTIRKSRAPSSGNRKTTRAGGTALSAPASRWTQTASASSAPITWEAATAPQAPLPPCPADGQPYGSRFPHVEIADQARLQALLLDSLGIERVHLMGPSVGGLIALSFACQFPERVRASSPSAPVTGLPLNTACPCLNKSWPLSLTRISRAGIITGDRRQKRAGVRPYHRPQIICLPGRAGTARQKRGGEATTACSRG